jgi:hypothetical protein
MANHLPKWKLTIRPQSAREITRAEFDERLVHARRIIAGQMGMGKQTCGLFFYGGISWHWWLELELD